MTLTPGTKLTHYEITNQIGRGGMGEVYQAKDTKLGRDVAIKVLPEEFARDADRVARFQREAKLLASLNHPNIAAIHGLEESEGTHFLVMELIEGQTLKDRIKSGPIPVEEALKLALQMAEALEAAHEKGVIHRDLKPANIKVTPDGKVKILDFGLAKAYVGDQENLSPMNSPTISAAATQKGVILGTAAYMSPEQAKGKGVDKRADIWAFGVVLFEMLTGRQLFTGETASETLASVMKSEPEWENLPPNLHSRIQLLLERCLKKEPKNRYSGISDARVDVQEVLDDPSGIFAQPARLVEPQRKLQTIFPWVAVTAILCLIIAGVAVWKLKPSEPRQVVRFSYELPEGQQFSNLDYPAIAVTADGARFAYSTPNGIYLRSVNELAAKLVVGTEGETQQPFFSPDGKWIGYFSPADAKLKKITVGGGAAVSLCAVTQFLGANWDESNEIVYGQTPGGILRVSANGGTPETLVKAVSQSALSGPFILPDRKSILFTDRGPDSIMVQSLESGKRRELLSEADGGGSYLPSGHMIYGMSNTIFAMRFDVEKSEGMGERISIVQQVYGRQYAVSGSGTLVYIPGEYRNESVKRTLVWVDKSGKEEPLGTAPEVYGYPRISPDGTRIALSYSSANNTDVWIWDLARKMMTRLTFGEKGDFHPIWTPDGKSIAFGSDRNGLSEVFWKAADGTGDEEKLVSAPDRDLFPSSWSSDGKSLVMDEAVETNLRWDIGVISMEGERKRKPLLNEEYWEVQPRISPDGRWLAYMSGESGQNEIFVRPFPDVNHGRWQISTNGGHSPLWSPNGKELFYLNGDSVMAVAVQLTPTFTPDTPRSLFRGTHAIPSGMTPWDIHPDGKRFLMMKNVATEGEESAAVTPREINIVVNWSEELKERVPVD
jgi:serine/threonine protein kinase/Tol biopolymer transport system component